MDLNDVLTAATPILASAAAAGGFLSTAAKRWKAGREIDVKSARKDLKDEKVARAREVADLRRAQDAEKLDLQADIAELRTQIDEMDRRLKRELDRMRDERLENDQKLRDQEERHRTETQNLQDRLQLANIDHEHAIGTIYHLREFMITHGLTPPESI